MAPPGGAPDTVGVSAWVPAIAVLLAALPGAAQAGGSTTDPAFAGTGSAREIPIPGGVFRAGERVGPLQDTVAYDRVSPFRLDATEVTVSEYGVCVRAGRCTPAASTVRWSGLSPAEQARWSAACNADRADRAEHPVNCVDWYQARAFCEFAGKRLPTEQEWEWAARDGAAGARYPWGEDPPGDRACWSGEGTGAAGLRDGTCAVGSHPRGATRSGLEDLAGNVWEWTATHDVLFPDSRGRGGTPARIVRGGGWGDTAPAHLAAARRAKDAPGDRAADLGFRCARSR